MKLKGELAEKAKSAENKEELKKIMEEAGMELSDDELDQVSGGSDKWYEWDGPVTAPTGGQ